MKKKKLSALLLLSLLLTGCSSSPKFTTDGRNWEDDWINIGSNIGIEAPKELTLSDNKDALAADGLYYATWVAGGSVPYKNSDGETIDLYDAQLYFLAGESPSEESAREECSIWLTAAKENYEIQTETEITCNGQSYTLITYNCAGEDTPYDRGASAFGTCGVNAVCAEFTSRENYQKDLTPILTEFLNNCHYRAD